MEWLKSSDVVPPNMINVHDYHTGVKCDYVTAYIHTSDDLLYDEEGNIQHGLWAPTNLTNGFSIMNTLQTH